MLETRVFFIFVLLGTAALGFLQLPPSGAPFHPDQTSLRQRLDRLPETDLASLKYRHAAQSARFQVGLFGNSRAVQVSAKNLGLDETSFFNFALPGTSFRQSVVFLEALVDKGKGPKTALISFDNAALQFYGNATWPTLPARWRQVWRDITYGLSQDVDNKQLAKNIVRHLWTDWQFVKALFSMTRLINKTGFWQAGTDAPPQYRVDGSRDEGPVDSRVEIEKLTPQSLSVLTDFLAFELKRLADLRAYGTTVIVYESPVAPGSYEDTAPISVTRASMMEACRKLMLTCIPAAELVEGPSPPFWQDSSHAPSALLGAWLSEIVAKQASIRK